MSLNEEVGAELFPGPEEQKKDPFLVEFGPNDPDDPKVKSSNPLRRSSRKPNLAYLFLIVLVCRLQMVYDHGRRSSSLECVSHKISFRTIVGHFSNTSHL